MTGPLQAYLSSPRRVRIVASAPACLPRERCYIEGAFAILKQGRENLPAEDEQEEVMPVQEGWTYFEDDGLARWIATLGLARQRPIAQPDPAGIDKQWRHTFP